MKRIYAPIKFGRCSCGRTASMVFYGKFGFVCAHCAQRGAELSGFFSNMTVYHDDAELSLLPSRYADPEQTKES